jgi:hypothetical protein
MKNIFKYKILLAGFAFFFSACDKQSNTEMENSFDLNKDQQLAKKITTFLSKIKNPHKSGETLTVDDAVWNTEAGLNFSYGDAGSVIHKTTVDSCFVEIPVENDQVELTDLAGAYDSIEEAVLEFYNNADASFIIAMDVKVAENMNKSSTVTLKTTTTVSSGPVYPGSPFESWDYWYWDGGFNSGYCYGDSVNVDSDSDAAKEIQFKIHQRKAVPGGKHYFTDIIDVFIGTNPNPNDPTPKDNYFDKLMFYNYEGYPNFHQCLSPEEMNFYLVGTETVIYNTASDTPPGAAPPNKMFISCELWGDYDNHLGLDKILHVGWATYGIPHSIPDPDEY